MSKEKSVRAELVRLSQSGGVFELELNDPSSRNAMSEEMAAEFYQRVLALRENPEVRVLVLTGAGQAFSGGGHLDMLFEKTKLSREKNRELMELFYRQFLSVRDLDVPVIAKVNGHAVGAGLCLAMACDIRIAAEEAKLGLNFVQLGLHPGMGATYFLPRLVGAARAAELLFSGKIITAKYAAEIGLVNECVAGDTLSPKVAELAQTIASAGPEAVRALKASLRLSEQLPLAECLRRESGCQARNYVGAEFLEGITAAKEKRKPRFV
ncbi:MAG: enoyl-CoA hydratase/isomerase family protein [Bdellovibrionota bacterium]